MSGASILSGSAALLLDILPVAALIALAVGFLRGRHRRRTEERELNEAIAAFRQTENDADGAEREK